MAAAWRASSRALESFTPRIHGLRHRMTFKGQALAIGGPFPRTVGKVTMAKRRPSPGGPELLQLPEADYHRLSPLLTAGDAEARPNPSRGPWPDRVRLLPTEAVLSALTVMQDGNAIEVATIGNGGTGGVFRPQRHDVAAPGDCTGRGRGSADCVRERCKRRPRRTAGCGIC